MPLLQNSPSQQMEHQVVESEIVEGAVREEENECAIGGLRNAARSVTKLPNWSLVGCCCDDRGTGGPANLGDKTESHVVPETLCAILRLRMKDMLELCDEDLQP